MDSKIVKSNKEIEGVLDQVFKGIEEGSQYPGMYYEEGVQNMYDWLIGNADDAPFD